jgi:hypothetical protein
MRDGPDCAVSSTLLNEIEVPVLVSALITDLKMESGTVLLTGLTKDALMDFSVYLPSRMALFMIMLRA